MRRPIGVTLVAVLFVLLSVNGLLQVALRMAGKSTDPPALSVLQLASGLTALMTAIGAWRNARWSSIASLVYGLVTACLLLSLPHLLGLDADARGGIWSGAAVILLLGVSVGWYLHRQHGRVSAIDVPPSASTRV